MERIIASQRIQDIPRLRHQKEAPPQLFSDTNRSSDVDAIMEPGRIDTRESLRRAVEDKFSSMPSGVVDQAVYLAVKGDEPRILAPMWSLAPERASQRIQDVQKEVIERLSKNDKRFENGNPIYDDRFRTHIHNGIEDNYPDNIRNVLSNVALGVDQKDDIVEMLYDTFPYFNDVLDAAAEQGALDISQRRALELLHVENRIARMQALMYDTTRGVVAGYEASAYEWGMIQKIGGSIGEHGQVVDGKIDKALKRRSEISNFSLPTEITFGERTEIIIPYPRLVFVREDSPKVLAKEEVDAIA